MNKKFEDIFKTLKLNNNMMMFFNNTIVSKISANRANTRIRINIESDHIIEKKYCYALEREIKNQLFKNDSVEIIVSESFRLSKAYTPKEIIEAYRDSILTELKHAGYIEYMIFKNARFRFDDGNVTLMLEDTFITHEKTDNIVLFLEKILKDRCHIDTYIIVEYFKPEARRNKAFEDKILSNEVSRLVNITDPNTEESDEEISQVQNKSVEQTGDAESAPEI